MAENPLSPTGIDMSYPRNTSLAVSGCLLVVTISAVAGCNLWANRHNNCGRLAYESGQIANAVNEFQTALTFNPRNADAYYNLGTSYYQLGKQNQNSQWVNQAEQLFRQAISLNGRHVEAHRSLACLLIETNREKHAFDLVNSWRERNPLSPEPLIETARLYQEYGDHRRSVDFLADALKLDSQNVRALKAMGHVREAQGQLNLALDNYQRALDLDPSQVDIAARVGDIRNRLARLQVESPVSR
jgi:tetratricopeptide (TPR) repeat protein